MPSSPTGPIPLSDVRSGVRDTQARRRLARRGTTRSGALVCATLLLVALGACDDAPTEPTAGLDEERATLGWVLGVPSLDSVAVASAELQLRQAERVEAHWTPEVARAVSAARAVLTGAPDEAEREPPNAAPESTTDRLGTREARAEALLAAVHWSEWVTVFTGCARAGLLRVDASVERATEAQSARARRARRLLAGVDDARAEGRATKAMQRAFYACGLGYDLD